LSQTEDTNVLREPIGEGSSIVDVTTAFARLMSEDRAITDQELLLAGVIQLLGPGGRTSKEVLKGLSEIWPGTTIAHLRVNEVLVHAEALELVTRSIGSTKSELWALTPEGHIELEITNKWHADVLNRFAVQVREAATEAFGGDQGLDQAHLWANVLEAGLRRGLLTTGTGYDGRVETVDHRILVPRTVDINAIREALNTDGSREEVKSFLYGCIEAALDVTDLFGAELVTLLVVGFVLHASVARIDQAAHIKSVGPLRGQRAILDTPTLYGLVGTKGRQSSIEAVIKATVDAGIEVIVADHTLEEVVASVQHARLTALPDDYINQLPDELAAYGRLVDSDIISIFAEASGEGRYRTWDEFEQATSSVRIRLRELGVDCRPHGNCDPETVTACRQVLTHELAARGRSRPAGNVDRDANTLAMAWRTRRRAPRDAKWPGAWVITPDKFLGPAMLSLETASSWPFTLTLAQLAAIVTRCAEVPEIADLTRAAALLVTHEAADALACRYPPEVAAELARSLIAERAGTPTDVRVAQGGIGGVVQALEISDPGFMMRRVLAQRSRRMRLAQEWNTTTTLARAVAAEDQQLARTAELETERKRQQELLQSLRDAENTQLELSQQLCRRDEEAEQIACRQTRQRRVDGVIVLHLLAAIVLGVSGHWLPALLVGASLIVLFYRLRLWVRNGGDWLLAVIIGSLTDFLGVAIWLWNLLHR
jgi:hypothetical protein